MPQGKPSQDFVEIDQIRDGLITMKSGGIRAILMTSSVNLALKSIEEQEATVIQFQNFLNTLDFPVQIVAQSRKMDIRPYLTLLEQRYETIQEELLKVQTREYIQYIRQFSEQVDIMSKSFFVVVPYGGAILSSGGGGGISGMFSGLFGGSTSSSDESKENERFERKRSQIEQRIGTVESGLTRLGLRVRQLNTEEVIELFYGLYNPGDARKSIIKTDQS